MAAIVQLTVTAGIPMPCNDHTFQSFGESYQFHIFRENNSFKLMMNWNSGTVNSHWLGTVLFPSSPTYVAVTGWTPSNFPA